MTTDECILMDEVAHFGEPGVSWCDIAASAYRAYAASTGNKNFRGDPMPQWGDLPEPIRTAWEAAVRQARWAGWLPPHLRKRPS